jgi:hypothetical protein
MESIMAKKPKKTYVVVTRKNSSSKEFVDTSSEFTGTEPAQAASKAARRGLKQIFLREKGVTDRVREYKGTIQTKTLTADTPFKKKGEKVQVGKAKYIGVIKLK